MTMMMMILTMILIKFSDDDNQNDGRQYVDKVYVDDYNNNQIMEI